MQKSHSPKESLHPKIITINILDFYLKFFFYLDVYLLLTVFGGHFPLSFGNLGKHSLKMIVWYFVI